MIADCIILVGMYEDDGRVWEDYGDCGDYGDDFGGNDWEVLFFPF